MPNISNFTPSICPYCIPDPYTLIQTAISNIQARRKKKLKAIWLETSGCFGEIISLLNGEDPDIIYWLQEIMDVTFFESIMTDQGETAYEQIVKTVNSGEEYIVIVSGAVPLAENGNCTILGSYQGRYITAAEAVIFAASNASEIVCVGTCASYGGPTAASPNVTDAVDIGTFLKRKVLRAPGCPCNPIWMLGIFAYLVNFGHPETDEEGRPLAFYSKSIHDHCPRRMYFDKKIFATELGQPECMRGLGCKGPRTKTLCPFTRWNNSKNWPIGDNTPCIGCANKGFPDKMEPFVTYPEGEKRHE